MSPSLPARRVRRIAFKELGGGTSWHFSHFSAVSWALLLGVVVSTWQAVRATHAHEKRLGSYVHVRHRTGSASLGSE